MLIALATSTPFRREVIRSPYAITSSVFHSRTGLAWADVVGARPTIAPLRVAAVPLSRIATCSPLRSRTPPLLLVAVAR